MNAWVIFRRARITLFSFMILICLSWAILFAIFLSHEWSHFSPFHKVVVVSLLSLYGFTAILLYMMVVVHFRLWWDVARVFALLVVHTGSSVLFTMCSSGFPCHGFGTETACRDLVYTIFIGCWVLSGIILCFAIALGVMAFIPRPVESLQGTEEVDAPSSPASFKAGSPTDEGRITSFYSIDSRTGLVTYNNGGKLPEESPSRDRTPSPVNSAYGETVAVGPARLWHGFENPNPRHSNNFYGGTISMRNASTEHTGVVSGPWRVDSFHRNPLGNPPSPPASIYSRASDYSQREQTYQGRPRTATPSVYTFRSSAASVHSVWAEPTAHVSPPPALTPGITRSRGQSPFRGRKDPSSENNASFATGGSNVPLKPRHPEPHRTVQHYGGLSGYQSYVPTVKASPLSRKGSDGQVLDQTQWWQLVLGAAAKS